MDHHNIRGASLVGVDERGHFYVSEYGRKIILSSVNSSGESGLRIVSVVGRYRTGKSSLLNGIAGGCPVFDTSSTVQAHTKGILCQQLADGTILLDTEGLGSTQANVHHDACIFALTMLLSSGCIYSDWRQRLLE